MFKGALQDVDAISINGQINNNLRYADDAVLLTDSVEGLQSQIKRMYRQRKQPIRDEGDL